MSGPVGTADIVNPSYRQAIMAAIKAIGVAHIPTGITDPRSGLPFAYKGSCLYDGPRPDEVSSAGGLPFFAVTRAQAANYYDPVSGASGPLYSRVMDGQSRLIGWDFWTYSVLDYSPATSKTQDFPLAESVLDNTEAVFQKYFQLPDANGITCEETELFFPQKPIQPIQVDGADYLIVTLGIRAKEGQKISGYNQAGWTH